MWLFGPFNCLFRNLLRISDRLIYNMTIFGIFIEFHYFGVQGARGPKERGGAQAGGVRNFWHRPKIKVVWYDEPLCQNLRRYSKVKYHGIFFRLDPPHGSEEQLHLVALANANIGEHPTPLPLVRTCTQVGPSPSLHKRTP